MRVPAVAAVVVPQCMHWMVLPKSRCAANTWMTVAGSINLDQNVWQQAFQDTGGIAELDDREQPFTITSGECCCCHFCQLTAAIDVCPGAASSGA